jgi:hypothetical protein
MDLNMGGSSVLVVAVFVIVITICAHPPLMSIAIIFIAIFYFAQDALHDQRTAPRPLGPADPLHALRNQHGGDAGNRTPGLADVRIGIGLRLLI